MSSCRKIGTSDSAKSRLLGYATDDLESLHILSASKYGDGIATLMSFVVCFFKNDASRANRPGFNS